MTADQIQDALTLLPADLVAETDRQRSRRPKRRHPQSIAALAACLALMMGGSFFYLFHVSALGGGSKGATTEAALAAPALPQEPEAEEVPDSNGSWKEAPAAEAAPMETTSEDLCGLPTAPPDSQSAAGTSADARIDHSHHPAEPEEETDSIGWCGNITATVYFQGQAYSLSGSDAVTLTDILYGLPYDPAALCRCEAQFTADTEMGTGYEINLTEHFARCADGQAPLTSQQAEALQAILDAYTTNKN